MPAHFCSKKVDEKVKVVHYEKDFMITLCVLNFVLSPVAALGNLLVICALWKASSIPANARKLFLSLAFSDLAVGMFSHPMTAANIAVMLKMASNGDYNFDSMCPTNVTAQHFFFSLFGFSSFLNIIFIAVDRLLAILLHLRYQELVTSKRITVVLIFLWLTSVVAASIHILLPEGSDIVATIIGSVGLLLTTAAYIRIYKVVRHHQNRIQSQLQMQNAQAVELLQQNKSAYNALFIYLGFLVCYVPFYTSEILYITNTLRTSFLKAKKAAFFMVFLNPLLNPLVYYWRYREIREIVKSTVKKIFRMNEEDT